MGIARTMLVSLTLRDFSVSIPENDSQPVSINLWGVVSVPASDKVTSFVVLRDKDVRFSFPLSREEFKPINDILEKHVGEILTEREDSK